MAFIVKKEYMEKALEEAYSGIDATEGGPFGAVIIREGEIIGRGHNTVLKDNDPTSHAEVNAIREASGILDTYDLSGAVIYSTTEPCPMCFSAVHWARIDKVIFGTYIEDVKALGFNELTVSCERMKQEGQSSVEILPGFMRDECMKLLLYWDNMTDKRVY